MDVKVFLLREYMLATSQVRIEIEPYLCDTKLTKNRARFTV